MAGDLKLIYALWEAAKEESPDAVKLVDYPAVLFAGIALLKNKALAQRFVDEAYPPLAPEPVLAGAAEGAT